MDALKLANAVLFLSTLSLRRATKSDQEASTRQGVSIHALLAESDSIKPIFSKINTSFYPRSPCGERQPAPGRENKNNMVSIHALLAESDRFYPLETLINLPFLSTLSLRRATASPNP